MRQARPSSSTAPRAAALAVALLALALLAACPASVAASAGDRSFEYQSCLQACVARDCTPPAGAAAGWTPQRPESAVLRATLWDCPHDCRYECMHAATQAAQAAGRPVQQFHGKWPFVRLLGMQEPASVVFSFFNGLAHFRGVTKYTKALGRHAYPLYGLVRLSGLLSINTWVWSAVYHTRDFDITERLDYFSAMASIVMSLHIAIVRVLRLPRRHVLRPLVAVTLLAFFVAHVSYLSFWRFDYGYNMKAGIAIGVLFDLVWLAWAAANWSEKRHYAWKIVVFVVMLSAAMSLELLDFPPIAGILDAHSLWHAATIFAIPVYWDFLISDALDHVRRVKLL